MCDMRRLRESIQTWLFARKGAFRHLVLEHEAEARLAVLHVTQGLLRIRHRAGLDDGLDVVLVGEVEKLLDLGGAADQAAGERERLADELLRWQTVSTSGAQSEQKRGESGPTWQ